jgi:predicted nucleotidyltransferase
MREQILTALKEIEADQMVSILFACESGSRAWGFASQDSDYDVRFIYAHKPEWYLSIDQARDVIERQLPGDLDVSGWELRKALRLYRKSNPPLLEWLQSPIIYSYDADFVDRLKAVDWSPEVTAGREWKFSPHRCLKHYYSMARGNVRNYFDADEVPLKKYLYILRPILACLWIEQRMSLPPVLFEELVHSMVPNVGLRNAIEILVAKKRAGRELGIGRKIEVIDAFTAAQMTRLAEVVGLPDSQASTDGLNKLFVETIGLGAIRL